MSENKEKTYTNSFAKEMATQAVTSAVVSAAVLGTYAAFAAVGWYLQKKDKSNN